MRKLSLSLLTLSLGVALLPLAQAATTPAQEHLLEQVRLGEASNREDLVRQSLYRLELIDPNNPDLIAARRVHKSSSRRHGKKTRHGRSKTIRKASSSRHGDGVRRPRPGVRETGRLA